MNDAERIAAEEKATRLMLRARSALVIREPWWGVLALRLQPIVAWDRGTAATDGVVLKFNPAFVIGLTDEERIGLQAHEVEHPARGHIWRRGSRDPELWNIACDLAINWQLAQKFTLPKGALLEAQFNGWSAEQIYSVLDQQVRDGKRPKPGPGEGTGFGGVEDAPQAGDAEAKEELQRQWAVATKQAAMIAKAQGAGSLPAGIEQALGELGKPRVDWREELRRFGEGGTERQTTWNRPNRRFASTGLYLPGSEHDGVGHLGVVTDDSGSMDTKAVAAGFAEIQAMLDDGGVERVTSVLCHTDVHGFAEYNSGEYIAPPKRGSGGTKFSPAFAWFKKNAPDVQGIVYFTDLDCYDFGPDPGIPVLWGVYGKPRKAPPFGRVVEIDPNR